MTRRSGALLPQFSRRSASRHDATLLRILFFARFSIIRADRASRCPRPFDEIADSRRFFEFLSSHADQVAKYAASFATRNAHGKLRIRSSFQMLITAGYSRGRRLHSKIIMMIFWGDFPLTFYNEQIINIAFQKRPRGGEVRYRPVLYRAGITRDDEIRDANICNFILITDILF